MRDKPRTELFFNVVQTAKDTNYVPTPTRDEALADFYRGKPRGIVIARNQKIGTRAATETMQGVADSLDEEHVRSAADVLSLTTLGTAYHTFAEQAHQDVMYRRVEMPRIISPKNERRMSREELVSRAITGLAYAAEQAILIEELLLEQRVSELKSANKEFGSVLAAIGLELAVINSDVPELRLGDHATQHEVWQAAQRAYTRTIELSGQIGTRPTLAQLNDEHSPLRRNLNDDPESVTQPVHKVLLEEIDAARAQFAE